MTYLYQPSEGDDWLPADEISQALSDRGYIVLPDIIPEPVLDELLAATKCQISALRSAGIGRGNQAHLDDVVRRDRIAWLEPDNPALRHWFQGLERLRAGLNSRLFLGLWDVECHLAHYSEGAFYRRHFDAFQGRSNRRVSLVAYLNPDWSPDQGGELMLYTRTDKATESVVQVAPLLGTVVLFLSEDIPHEVLPVCRDRFSVAGWFRVNATSDHCIDPAR